VDHSLLAEHGTVSRNIWRMPPDIIETMKKRLDELS